MNEEGFEALGTEFERLNPLPLLFDAVSQKLRMAAEAHMVDSQQAHLQFDRDPFTHERVVVFGLAENFEEWVKNEGEVMEITVPIPEDDLGQDGDTLTRLLNPDYRGRHFKISWRKAAGDVELYVGPTKIDSSPSHVVLPLPGLEEPQEDRLMDLMTRIITFDGVPIRKRRLA